MRVLIIAALPPERPSMVGRILPLARAARAAGHDVVLYTLSGQDREAPSPGSETGDDPWCSVVGPNLRATDDRRPDPLTVLRRWRAGLRGLRHALAAERPEVVVLAKPQLQNTAPALELAARAGAPLVVDADDLEAAASRLPWPLRAHAAALEARAARAATLITACSPYLAAYYQKLTPRTRVALLPTGIALPEALRPVNLRQRLGLAPETKILLYLGSLSLASGHRVDLLLDAFATVVAAPRSPSPTTPSLVYHDTYREKAGSPVPRDPNARRTAENLHLVLAGTGIDEPVLRARLSRWTRRHPPLASRVHFFGRFTPPEDFALAREADLLVDPVDASPANQAKSSHRVLLALATGTPIVVGAVGIRRALLPADLHALCLHDPDAPGALADALRRGLDPHARMLFRQRTEGVVERYRWEVLGEQFVRFLEASTRPAVVDARVRAGSRLT